MQINFTKAQWLQGPDGLWLSLLVQQSDMAKSFCKDKKDVPYTAEIKEYREKRSLDANAYFWLLLGKLAAKLGQPKDLIYREYIKRIGDNYEIFPIKNEAVDTWTTRIWPGHGLGWVCDILGESKIAGYTNVVCYYGSSVYDTAQMSRLINEVVIDCQDNGIPTDTLDEIAKRLALWEGQNGKEHHAG